MGFNLPKRKINPTEIKTFDEACTVKGLNPKRVLKGLVVPHEIAYRKLVLIASVLNEGWEPNFEDGNEQKYWPYFQMVNRGNTVPSFAFDIASYDYSYSGVGVGSRISYKTEELAEYAGRTFIDIYKDFLM